jgi:hypothetical protein
MENWQNLPKNAEDNEKVEEAIDRKIGDHLDDPEAHILPNQSLADHRASKVVDHLARSIVGDKLNNIDTVLSHEAICTITSITTSGSNKIIAYTSEPDIDIDSALRFVYFLTGSKAGSIVKILADGTYTITVLASDVTGIAVGNQFFITKVKVSPGAYGPQWHQDEAFAYNGHSLLIWAEGAYIEYTKECDRIEIYGIKNVNGGIVDIYIDDVLEETIDLYAEGSGVVYPIFVQTFETTATRTFKIVVTGDANPSAGDTECRITSFDTNGIIDYSSIRLLRMYHYKYYYTGSGGSLQYDVEPPPGYRLLGCVGQAGAVQENDDHSMTVFWNFSNGPKGHVVVSNVKGEHEMEIETEWLMVKDDSIWENTSA